MHDFMADLFFERGRNAVAGKSAMRCLLHRINPRASELVDATDNSPFAAFAVYRGGDAYFARVAFSRSSNLPILTTDGSRPIAR
jgi:hypothetical protein